MMSGKKVGEAKNLLYLDNAATSWPKPPGVAPAMVHFIESVGANPGRSGHRLSVKAARIVYDAREALARFFNMPDPLRVIFGLNITDGINLALHGLLKQGDHVVTTSMEHNAVMRPLHQKEKFGVEFTQVACEQDGTLNPEQIESAIQPNTRLVVVNHASNVCGTLLPIKEIGKIVRDAGLLFLVDSAQSAGAIEIDMAGDLIDLLAFTGHKSLYGPMGTGGLIVGKRVDVQELSSLRQGGTGSRSEREEQPDFMPDCYESGTSNAVGLAGLLASLTWLNNVEVQKIQADEEKLCQQMINGLMEIPNIRVYGTHDAKKQTATVAWNMKGVEPSTIGMRLDEEFGILCRVGLHCAPSAHRTIGTFPDGCVRFGLGAFNSEPDVERALQSVARIAKEES